MFDVLSRLISHASSNGLIKGLLLAPTAPILTHLFFADDAIIFGQANKEEIYQIINIFNVFTAASGQKINLQKSGLICGKGISPVLKAELASILNIPIWDTPGKYLGIPVKWGNSKSQPLQWIKERVFSKLEG